jgi:hypothetical protein
MHKHLGQLAAPASKRQSARWLVLGGLSLAGGVLLLWWTNPQHWQFSLCAFHAATGLHCPGCGATRALHELLHGRVASAVQHNALLPLLLPPAVYWAASQTRYLVCGRELPGDLFGKPWFLLTVTALAALFGLLRNLPFYPFTQLSPPG